MSDTRVPGYEFPEDAARAVALAAKHGRWRARPEAEPPTPLLARVDEGAAIISAALGRGPGWLTPPEVASLLHCYGLPLIATRFVRDADEAVASAAELGTAIALKASASGLLHKTDDGGVRLGVRSRCSRRRPGSSPLSRKPASRSTA